MPPGGGSQGSRRGVGRGRRIEPPGGTGTRLLDVDGDARGCRVVAERLLRFVGLGRLRVEVGTFQDRQVESEEHVWTSSQALRVPWATHRAEVSGTAAWFGGFGGDRCLFGRNEELLGDLPGLLRTMARPLGSAPRQAATATSRRARAADRGAWARSKGRSPARCSTIAGWRSFGGTRTRTRTSDERPHHRHAPLRRAAAARCGPPSPSCTPPSRSCRAMRAPIAVMHPGVAQ